jgi:hypothetical protein
MKVLISVIPHGQETHGKLTFELWQIRHLDFQNRPPGSETRLRVQGAHLLEISWKGFMRLSDSLKSSGFVARMHA